MSSPHPITLRSAARSHVGAVRKNNQDSGYAGPNFLLIADGMGGHAGGDVASAITVARLADLDADDHEHDASEALRTAILDANERITNSVAEKPELAGMGTTVTALLRAGSKLALAHIGDSRGYLLRDGELDLVTHDHTFVQMLVDEGRITAEEAEQHPQRSVVMRVLGDVGAAPELDMSIREARLGDRWMLCSDGLTGFADIDEIKHTLATIEDPGACCDRLVEMALDGGGADNITVVIGDVVDADDASVAQSGESVGSVRDNPQFALLGQKDTPTELIDTGQFDTIGEESTDTRPLDIVDRPDNGGAPAEASTASGTAAAAGATAAGASAGATGSAARDGGARTATAAETREIARHDEDWDDDDRPRRRPLLGIIITIAVLAALVLAGVVGYTFIRGQYYVAADAGNVAVYRGIAQKLGPIELSELDETTEVRVDDLSAYSQRRIEQTIPASSRADADKLVGNLRDEAEQNAAKKMDAGATDDASTDPAPPPEDTGEPNPDSTDQQGQGTPERPTGTGG
ncbi:PP2C family protein-serine/threonine phosphatase [Brevibacterium luteolum]|uniref:PP2C family protein-serine/threonine phosphatase n=1 Tax=Brevibacterium luteolum TaxID=199591 RepID=UPI00223BF5C4|nr:PP2C family serine/threonine-protein phosphatase [Brevibacterium luteolum]MCT1873742.1 protein phosphatase 2C domain-containing protein [Brevibacterium luteolum]MCT1891146.1 protein phosphatase 2C domain-containing protein [Brevibacterium luteolum]MCT1893641.1 protein phosphatase 2C domain-containing protein [Brevibacterium luteolum]MCT1924435.1 protein phosphatase 2C domain-containing protein [Brevibacterium luteolum]